MFATITFTSDFGLSGGYVASCEAILARVAPGARVLHVDHQVRAGDVVAGAQVLTRVAPLGPVAVHLAVIDPGVGTDRRAVALHTGRGDFLVGPDNGLLPPVAFALGGVRAAWNLAPERVAQQAELGPGWRLSSTFHGRDLFAPAAALLARDLPGALIGDPIDPEGLVDGRYPRLEQQEGQLLAEATEIDRFGNVGLAVEFSRLAEHLEGARRVEIRSAGGLGKPRRARLVETFGDLAREEVGLIEDSWGAAALVMNGASAANQLGLSPGELVILAPAPGPESVRPDAAPGERS